MNQYAITLDLDWAPDWMIEDCLRVFLDRRVAATWFITHDTPVLAEILRRNDLFEAGIHPNCLPGSSHGTSEQEVMETMFTLLPEAKSMRTHGLYQSSSFLALAADMGIRNDVSLFLPWAENLSQHVLSFTKSILTRFPYFWEDDIAIETKGVPWSITNPKFHAPGLRIFDFHPVHIALNTNSLAHYERLKMKAPLNEWTRDMVEEHTSQGPGPATFFDELTQFLKGKGSTISELAMIGEKQ